MRDTYYQSVGNPLQWDRLPASRPTLQWRSPLAGETLLSALSCLMGATGLVLAVRLLYRAPGLTGLAPFDLLLAGPPLVVLFALWGVTGRLHWLLHPAGWAGVGLVAMTDRAVPELPLILAALAVGLWTYAFGWQAVVSGTAAPLPKNVAVPARQAAHAQLLQLSAAATVLTGFLLQTPAGVWLGIGLAMLGLGLVFPTSGDRSPSSLVAVGRALREWFSTDAPPLPGLWQSPCGSLVHRGGLVIAVAGLTTLAMLGRVDSPLAQVETAGAIRYAHQLRAWEADGTAPAPRFRAGTFTWLMTTAGVALTPVLLPLALVLTVTLPVLRAAAALRDGAQDQEPEDGLVPAPAIWSALRQSADPHEQDSLFLGHVVADGSPVLLPRPMYGEHAHVLGGSGANKTSQGLCPTIEQLVHVGPCSVVVLDLKADSMELYASLAAAAERAWRERGERLPLKQFSNQGRRATFAFNPLTQPFWNDFDHLTRTDILCGANGLTYGSDYGQGFYSSANAAILHHALKTFPHVATFGELADAIGLVLATAKKRELHPEIRKAGVHVHEVIKRLAACAALNVAPASGHPPDVVDEAIDLRDVFERPQLLYFHLSATLSPSGAPEIGRLVTYLLLAAATQGERRHPVYLVIDEFQRMVASNLEYMLQMARSMGVGIILANQTLEDLRKSTTNLIPAVEANCRLRQWFSVSAAEDQERLIRAGGLTVDRLGSRSESTNSDGHSSTSYSEQETVVSRITPNDIALVNDHPGRSFLTVSRGAGYAQYGGLPVIIESDYHISPVEYDRRKTMAWPDLPGTFVPQAHPSITGTLPPPGPDWTSEVLEDGRRPPLSRDEQASVDGLFEEFRRGTDDDPPPRRRRRP